LIKTGIPCDYELLDVNSAFADLIGLDEKELIGKRFPKLSPGLSERKPEWIRMVGGYCRKRRRERVRTVRDLFDAWFKIKILSPEKNYFILFILDTSTDNEQQGDLRSLDELFGDLNSNLTTSLRKRAHGNAASMKSPTS
jgi:PAS domain-containing protein